MTFFVANGFGYTLDAPSESAMRELLSELDTSDEDHGAAWLSTDTGYVLEWNGDGRLVFRGPDQEASRHMTDVRRDDVLAFWRALARGQLDTVEARKWRSGNGYVHTDARASELAAWQLSQDRLFYDLLGAERASIPCREPGCPRGAVALSVHCRAHHFEAVKGRPSPFCD